MIRRWLQNIVRGDAEGNLANKFRQKRVDFFIALLNREKDKVLKILDIGGTDYHWSTLNVESLQNLEIILLNPEKIIHKKPGYEYLVGDGRNLSIFEDNSVDLIYSNSVIEHVGGWDDQNKFAKEIKRVSKKYFIQTPNYYFPFEPHFLTFGIQYLPTKMRAMLIRHFNLGWFEKTSNYTSSIELAKSIRLLKWKEIKELFPEATIIRERFGSLTKSFIIYYGFEK
jgi:ubiquinone/menaquinone biosynthesis C-methylase UbiE